MTTVEEELLATLERLGQLVQSRHSSGPKPDLGPTLQKLDQLKQSLPSTTHPQLRHFMQNGSYEKARHWLEQRRKGSSEQGPGGCGRPNSL